MGILKTYSFEEAENKTSSGGSSPLLKSYNFSEEEAPSAPTYFENIKEMAGGSLAASKESLMDAGASVRRLIDKGGAQLDAIGAGWKQKTSSPVNVQDAIQAALNPKRTIKNAANEAFIESGVAAEAANIPLGIYGGVTGGIGAAASPLIAPFANTQALQTVGEYYSKAEAGTVSGLADT